MTYHIQYYNTLLDERGVWGKGVWRGVKFWPSSKSMMELRFMEED